MTLDDLQVSYLMARNIESLSELQIRDIKQWKYPIIYGHPPAEVFVGVKEVILLGRCETQDVTIA